MSTGRWSMDDHVGCARDIAQMDESFSYYIREMHQKKAQFKRKRYKLRSSDDDVFYSKFLFHKKSKRANVFMTFPSTFNSAMEDVMYLEHPSTANTNVYYGDDKASVQDLTPLCSSPTMTPGDREIITKLNHEYIRLMKKCISRTRVLGYGTHRKEMESWCRHVEKIMA